MFGEGFNCINEIFKSFYNELVIGYVLLIIYVVGLDYGDVLIFFYIVFLMLGFENIMLICNCSIDVKWCVEFLVMEWMSVKCLLFVISYFL